MASVIVWLKPCWFPGGRGCAFMKWGVGRGSGSGQASQWSGWWQIGKWWDKRDSGRPHKWPRRSREGSEWWGYNPSDGRDWSVQQASERDEEEPQRWCERIVASGEVGAVNEAGVATSEMDAVEKYVATLPKDSFAGVASIQLATSEREVVPKEYVARLLLPVHTSLCGEFVSELQALKEAARRQVATKAVAALREAGQLHEIVAVDVAAYEPSVWPGRQPPVNLGLTDFSNT